MRRGNQELPVAQESVKGLSRFAWVWLLTGTAVMAAVWMGSASAAALFVGLAGGLSLAGSI